MKKPMLSYRGRNQLRTFLYLAGICLLVFLIDFPIISMVGTAFKRNDAVLSTVSILPDMGDWSLENFQMVLMRTKFPRYMINSMVISVTATLICVTVSALAGYSVSRFRGIILKIFLLVLFVMQMFPVMLRLVPMYIMFTKLKMVNNTVSVVIYYGASNLAFNILLSRSFYDSIPRELEDAGRVDGCTRFGAYVRLIVPLSKPAIATVGIMTFLNCWNEFTMSNLLLRDQDLKTVTVGLTNFVTETTTNWGYMMAGSALAIVPALIFLAFAQKSLVEGLTTGAVKG